MCGEEGQGRKDRESSGEGLKQAMREEVGSKTDGSVTAGKETIRHGSIEVNGNNLSVRALISLIVTLKGHQGLWP